MDKLCKAHIHIMYIIYGMCVLKSRIFVLFGMGVSVDYYRVLTQSGGTWSAVDGI